jgi:biopolymer transport protein ExbD
LRKARADAGEPLQLVVQADKAVTWEKLVTLRLLARDAGIQSMWCETLPRPGAAR